MPYNIIIACVLACIAIAIISWFVFGKPSEYLKFLSKPSEYLGFLSMSSAPPAPPPMMTGRFIKVFRDDSSTLRTVLGEGGGIDAFDKDGFIIKTGIVTTDDGPTYTQLDLEHDTKISKIVVRNRKDGFVDRINGCRLVVTTDSGMVTLYTDLISGSHDSYTFTPPLHPPVLTICGYGGCA